MLARKEELNYYYPELEELVPTDRRTRRVPRRKKKKESKAMEKLIILGIAIIGLILSLVVLQGYANVTEIRTEITALERKNTELALEEEGLLSELERIKSSLKMENSAIMKLGMDYPREDQVVHVNVGEIIARDEADIGNEFIFVKKIRNIVDGVLSLF